jgi:hypothetical protein
VIAFGFTGRIAAVADRAGRLDGSLGVGGRVSGWFAFDPDAPDSNPDPTVGDYRQTAPGCGIVVRAGRYTFRTDPRRVDCLVEVVARRETANYLFRSYNNSAKGPGAPAGYAEHIAWQLDDPSGTAVASAALPAEPPRLSAWRSVFGLTVTGNGERSSEFFLRAHLDAVFWDAPARPPTARLCVARPTPARLAGLWDDLAGDDGPRGRRAAEELAAGAAEAAPFLLDRLRASADPTGEAARLVAALDSDDFAERERVTRELEALGEAAEADLRRALARAPSAEVRDRAGRLLAKRDAAPPGRERRRALRALHVLARCRAPEGRRALEELACGPDDDWLAREARAAAGEGP